MQQLYSEELSILLLSLTSGYLKEGRRYLYMVILGSHERPSGNASSFDCRVTSEFPLLLRWGKLLIHAHADMCVMRDGNHQPTMKVPSPVSRQRRLVALYSEGNLPSQMDGELPHAV